MKIRHGFVSNSSSSSFICDLSGQTESGMDCNLTDFGMVECVKGHCFIYEGFPEVEDWVATSDHDYDENNEDECAEEDGGGYIYNSECNYNMPSKYCPICQKDKKAMKQITQRIREEIARFGLTADDVK